MIGVEFDVSTGKESPKKHLSFMKHMNHFLFCRYVCLQGQDLQPRNEMEGWL